MNRTCFTLLAFASAAAFAPSARASIAPAPGWQNAVVQAAPGGTFPGGMDWLPNGRVALFDGTAIVEIDPATGSVAAVLYTPPSPVFGSFIEVDPTGTYLLFGESSNGTITRVPLNLQAPSPFATIAFNFDCAFAPDGAAFVSAGPSFVTTQIYRLDPQGGAPDLIADFNGPSGPIAFDAAGNLFYGENAAGFPAPVGTQTIFQFSASQVASAVGPGSLPRAQATPYAGGQTSPFDLAFDAEGDLFIADTGAGTVIEFPAAGGLASVVGAEAPFSAVTYLAFRTKTALVPGIFAPFQPETSGALAVLSTDFFSFNDLNVIRPKRAVLATTPANPIPSGSFTFSLAGGPQSGAALFFVAGAPFAPEFAVYSSGVPFLFGFAPGSLFGTAPAPLDAGGGYSVNVVHPGGLASVVVQAALVDPLGRPLGTSTALQLILQ